jgi:perosamine synthetase
MKKLVNKEKYPVIDYKFKKYNSIGVEERDAAIEVIESGNLSQFVGSYCEDFNGGPKVKLFEEICKKKFKVKHAISVNSWTSGLICAVGALEINPGDEIILSPWTMSACATAILHWGAIPIFADIEKETFNIDIMSIKNNISNKTKAIIAIDIFGHSCDIDGINKIATEFDLKVITDSAQAPWSKNKGRITGTMADIGGFSLNYHKHIHTGEGGVIVTNNDNYADRMRLIRNHAESVVAEFGVKNINNLVGYNFRLGEIECAIGIEQVKKLDKLVFQKRECAKRLAEELSGLKGLIIPKVKDQNTHSYYIFPMILDLKTIKTSRNQIVDELESEGVQGLMRGYVNLHLLPLFQKKIAYGSKGFPWSFKDSRKDINYSKGICPVAEDFQDKTFIGFEICLFDLSELDIKKIGIAFKKVWKRIEKSL